MKFKHKYSGLSLLELREKYGTGIGNFYDNTWWLGQSFAKEKAEPGIYEINLDEESVNKTFREQEKGIRKGWSVANPTVAVELALSGNEKVKNLLDKYWFRTSTLDSYGSRVGVRFCGGRLVVGYWWDGYRGDSLGVASSRKFQGNSKLEPSKLLNPCEDKEHLESVEKLEKIKELLEK